MKKIEAIARAIRDGAKIRKKCWWNDEYVYFDNDNYIWRMPGGVASEVDFMRVNDSSDAWEVFLPPKRKIKLYEFVYCGLAGDWFIVGKLHPDEDSVRKCHNLSDSQKVVRLDSMMIEIEVDEE